MDTQEVEVKVKKQLTNRALVLFIPDLSIKIVSSLSCSKAWLVSTQTLCGSQIHMQDIVGWTYDAM